MAYSLKIKRGESVIYILLWVIILLMPVFFSSTSSGIEWTRVFNEWIRFIPFLLVFLLHNFLLFPLLFVGNKRIWYFIAITGVIGLAAYFGDILSDYINYQPQVEPMRNPMRDMTPDMMPGPPHGEILPPQSRVNQPQQQPFHKVLIDNILVSILVVGFNVAIKISAIWQAEEQKNKELEKEKLETELAFLKYQVSPHFFMNTLNNIHALIDINSEDAKESVIKLSKLMRYLLYDSGEGRTTLTKEIEFINSYVDLMKLRFTSQVSVNLSFPAHIPNIEIPPMLFTSLLENAFKHGISYQKKSFVELVMNADQEFLYFRIKNSKKDNDNGLNEPGGIGLENLRKRLGLIYGKRYSLVQNENEDTFEINIKLPLND